MPRGEKLFELLGSLILRKFYGTVIIRFEAGKVTHVETETRRLWEYKDLGVELHREPLDAAYRTCAPHGTSH